MMLSSKSLWIVLLLSPVISVAQNLIPNPSFEEMWSCPNDHTTRLEPIKVRDWFSPSTGTPDLFSSCAFGRMSVPRNYAGIAYPPHGESYVGVYFGSSPERWTAQAQDYREYLSCQLEGPLKGDVPYRLSFYAKPATNSSFLIDQLSYAFTSDSVGVDHDGPLRVPFSRVSVDTVEVRVGWYFVETVFLATGGESYFIIGDFPPTNQKSFERMGGYSSEMKPGATYYLFDHFSLECLEVPLLYETAVPFSLDRIFFGFDSYALPDSAQVDIEDLALFLRDHEDFQLTIYGSTDEQGSEEYNDQLSLKRAQAVKEALVKQGVATERLIPVARGEREATEGADRRNRNTEFLLTLPEDAEDREE